MEVDNVVEMYHGTIHKPIVNTDQKFIIQSNSKTVFTIHDLVNYFVMIKISMNITFFDVNRFAKLIYHKLAREFTTTELKNFIISELTDRELEDYRYCEIAVWIMTTSLHEQTSSDYAITLDSLYYHRKKGGKDQFCPLISEEYYRFCKDHIDEINTMLDYSRDFLITYLGLRTVMKSYLKSSSDGKPIERLQHMMMRVAVAVHFQNPVNTMERIKETYDLISTFYFTHATPTIFNAGTRAPQMSSCFLLEIEDSMENIGEVIKDSLIISKHAGGIGINVTKIRSVGANISSTQGKASGIFFVKLFDNVGTIANQGGKRPGSIAIYLEPWHADVVTFLNMKRQNGTEWSLARNLFIGLVIHDIFMQRVAEDKMWSLFCPGSCPGLCGKYGNEFHSLYLQYESEGLYTEQMPARELMLMITQIQIESGMPYIIFKDHINHKSNHQNIGVINGSNLCTEIMQYHSNEEYAVCNLASICLPRFVENGEINYQKLHDVTRVITRNLNNVIDGNLYPVEKTRRSNLKTRPIGIGVQGLADMFCKLCLPFCSPEAKVINKRIFETIYHGALMESNELAKRYGPYEKFAGSPMSRGILQFDMWDRPNMLSGMWDWDILRDSIQEYGVRNSLVTTCMPTVSTSLIMGFSECVEPYTGNIFLRKVNSGHCYIVNRYLVDKLRTMGLWNEDMIAMINCYNGSIQKIESIPDEIREIFPTVWDVKHKDLIEMSADRGCFLDQSESRNVYISEPNTGILSLILFQAWKQGLKTASYYVRTMIPKAQPFGTKVETLERMKNTGKCERKNIKFTGEDVCETCTA